MFTATIDIDPAQRWASATFRGPAFPAAFAIWMDDVPFGDGDPPFAVYDSGDADPRPHATWEAALAGFLQEVAAYVTDLWTAEPFVNEEDN